MGPTDPAAPGSGEDAWGDEGDHEQVAPPPCPPPVELPPGLSWEAAAHWGTSTVGFPSPSQALSAHSDDFFDASDGLGGDSSAKGSVTSPQKAQKAPGDPTEAPQPISTVDGTERQGAAPSFAALEAQRSIAAEPSGWSESEDDLPEELQQPSDGGSQNADVNALVSNVQKELAQQELSDPGSMQMTYSGMSVPQRVVSASESDSEGPSSAMPDKPSGLAASAENQPSHATHRGASELSEDGSWGDSAAATDVRAAQAAETDAPMRPAVAAQGRSFFNEQDQKGGSDDEEEDAAWSEDASEEGSMPDESSGAMQADQVTFAAHPHWNFAVARSMGCGIDEQLADALLKPNIRLDISFVRCLQSGLQPHQQSIAPTGSRMPHTETAASRTCSPRWWLRIGSVQGPKPSVLAVRAARTPVYAKDEAPSIPAADGAHEPFELKHCPAYRFVPFMLPTA